MRRVYVAEDPSGLTLEYDSPFAADVFPRTGVAQRLTVWDDRQDGSERVYVAEFHRDTRPGHDKWTRFRAYDAWSTQDLTEVRDQELG